MDQGAIQIKDQKVIHSVISGVVGITPIIGKGDVNRVYIVEQVNRKVVIRLNKAEDLLRFQKEAWCLKTATEIGISSPQLIDMGTKNDTAYMILNFIFGLNGKEITESKEAIWKTIGSYAKQIHSIKTAGFGERMTSPGKFDDSWKRYLNYNITSLNLQDKLLELGALTKEQSELVKARFTSLQNKQFDFGLIHGDLSLENVIVDAEKVTLIDWGVAESTVIPHMEIVDLLQNVLSDTNPMFESFLQGYGMSRAEYESMRSNIQTLMLLQAIDKLRWSIDRKPDKIGEMSERVKSLV